MLIGFIFDTCLEYHGIGGPGVRAGSNWCMLQVCGHFDGTAAVTLSAGWGVMIMVVEHTRHGANDGWRKHHLQEQPVGQDVRSDRLREQVALLASSEKYEDICNKPLMADRTPEQDKVARAPQALGNDKAERSVWTETVVNWIGCKVKKLIGIQVNDVLLIWRR